MKISYVPQADIEKEKWDRCVEKSTNGVVYAYSFYLDAMSKHWDALIFEDYEIVMPLTWNRKYSIYYLYQPFFCAQLGIFGNNLTGDIVKLFLDNVPLKFKYWDFYLNNKNLFVINGFPMYERSNYVLSLKKSYEKIRINFAQSHIRNITRADKQGNVVRKNIPLSHIITLAKQQTKKFSPITAIDYEHFAKVFEHLRKKNSTATYGVYSAQGQLTASCAFIFSHNRAYYVLVGNHPNGRTSGASHLMIDHFIKEHAGEELLLDFEGSSVGSLAFFYKSFGATLEKYPGIKVNRLSPLAKLFKH